MGSADGRRVPTVAVSANWIMKDVPAVYADDTAIARMAAEHLLDLRLPHFASYGYPVGAHSACRQDAFAARVAENGMVCERYPWNVRRPEAAHAVRISRRIIAWLRALPKPVGIFAANDHLAWELSEICHICGLRVPDDVALIGVDNDTMLCELAWPPLSSVAMPAARIGYEAAALLDRMLDGEQPSREPPLIAPIGVVARQSTNILAIADAKVATAVRFIRDHAHEPIDVRQVLRAAPVARRTLERRFQVLLGRSIRAQIEKVRIETAQRLLAETHMTMGDVAEVSGFASLQRLFAAFRRATGTTPAAWRRQRR